MISLLVEGEYTARNLSQMLSIQEKEVYAHLSHVIRSVAQQKQRFQIKPSRCLGCGYVFDTRRRLKKPSRCPRCKGERIEEPSYRIV